MKSMTEEQFQKIQPKVLELIKIVDFICSSNNFKYSLAYGSVLGAVRHKGFIPWDADIDIIIPINDVEKFRKLMRENLPENMKIYEWNREEKYHPCFDRVAYIDLPHELFHVDVYALIGLPKEDKDKKRFIKKCYYSYHILSTKEKNLKYSLDKNIWKLRLIKAALLPISAGRIKKIYHKIQNQYPYSEAENVYAMTSIYQLHDFTDKEALFDVIRVPFEDTKLPIPKCYDEYLTHIYGNYMTPRRDK